MTNSTWPGPPRAAGRGHAPLEPAEGMRFLRFETRAGATVAVFRLEGEAPERGPEPKGHDDRETAFDRPSLETRLANLKARRLPHRSTEAVLARWPRSGVA